MKHVSLFLLLYLVGLATYSQDIHFSQFNKSYLNLNPALTGSFDGDYRFNGNFRNQWSSIAEPYRTFSAAFDAKSPINSIPNLGLGLVLLNDEAGIGGLTTTQINLSAAYLYKLTNDSSLIAKGGLQLGYAGKRVDFNRFSFDRQYNGRQFDGSLSSGEDFDRNSFSYLNMAVGVGLEYILENRKKFNFGFAAFNLNGPNQSFDGATIPLDVRTSIYINSDYYISEKVDLLPSLLFSSQGKFREVLFGSDVRYRFQGQRSLVNNLYGGLWYRNKDAVIISIGVDYQQWNVGMSYDINTSDLKTATNRRGGLEIAVTYILKTFNPNIRRYKVCPNFM